jgi:hypothetical protein
MSPPRSSPRTIVTVRPAASSRPSKAAARARRAPRWCRVKRLNSRCQRPVYKASPISSALSWLTPVTSDADRASASSSRGVPAEKRALSAVEPFFVPYVTRTWWGTFLTHFRANHRWAGEGPARNLDGPVNGKCVQNCKYVQGPSDASARAEWSLNAAPCQQDARYRLRGDVGIRWRRFVLAPPRRSCSGGLPGGLQELPKCSPNTHPVKKGGCRARIRLPPPGDGRWESVDDPKIEQPTDALVRVEATTVCVGDVHTLRGDIGGV